MFETNREISITVQQKFEFYFLSLTFVILGLSIQTAKLGTSIIPDLLEIIGWILLLISGIAGLSRMEWLPQIYNVIHEMQDREKYRDEAKKRITEGDLRDAFIIDEGELPIKEFLVKIDEGLKTLNAKVDKLEKKSLFKYKIHKYAFVFGVILLVASRSYIPLGHILNRIIAA